MPGSATGFGLVLQGYGLVHVLTAAENVEVVLQARDVDRATTQHPGHRWCLATEASVTGDLGTPGQENSPCTEGARPSAAPVGSSSLDAAAPGAGEVVITEFLADAGALDDANGEWVELTNVTDTDLDLSGCSLSDDGRVAAYTRGDPPFLEVVHHTLATGQTVAVAPGVAPAWCPAVSPDGREIVFVATTEGRPRWWRGVVGERVGVWEAVGADAPFATGPSAPRVYGDALVFENEAGVHSLGLDGTTRRALPGLHNPVMHPRELRVFATRSATDLQLTRIDVALRTGSPR